LLPPGLPNDNDTVYCPHNQTTCYWQQGGSYTYQQAKDRCASLSGYIVSWNDASEQLQIENYFRVRALTVATAVAGSTETWRVHCEYNSSAVCPPLQTFDGLISHGTNLYDLYISV
jgi:hypothetical protein